MGILAVIIIFVLIIIPRAVKDEWPWDDQTFIR